MSNNKKDKVLVIAHDAGAAEVIAAYVKKHSEQKDFHVFVAGPAVKIFRRRDIPLKRIPLSESGIVRVVKQHADARSALLGTGWMTTVESNALREAKKIGLKTVVYLDSWVNYRERFGYPHKGWRKNLPDEFWVGDKYALVLAKKYFSKIRIRIVPNQYFAHIISEYKSLSIGVSHPLDVLFLSDAVPGVEEHLEGILKEISRQKKAVSLSISFHPADDVHRYDELIERYQHVVQIKKITKNNLIQNLSRARVVIGTETVALVVASLVGKKTISIIPPGRKSHLPFPQILLVKNAKAAVALI